MEKKAEEDEIEEAPAARKRKREASTAASSDSDDVLLNILARLPARTAVASMALSTHHRRLIRCPEFRTLHCHLSPPLPHPQIAFVATAKLRRSADQEPVSGFLGFHVAGAAAARNRTAAPMRALAGGVYLHKKCANACNGVVLLAGEPRPATCVLWNPAVADEEREVTVPVPARYDCAVLGLGYGRTSKTYKLLLSRRRTREYERHNMAAIDRYPRELIVYALGGAGEQPRLRTVQSSGLDGEISDQSLYIDGTIYLLHVQKSAILAFDVDDEKVAMIDLPGERKPGRPGYYPTTKLMAMSGRPCVERNDGYRRELWLLTEDRRWEQRCVIGDEHNCHREGELDRFLVVGVWDCGGVLILYIRRATTGQDMLCLYHVATKTLFKANVPGDMTLRWSKYAFCWGYKPTLVSPASIVGELFGDGKRRRTMDIMEAVKPVYEQDKRRGQEATLGTVCFMEFLARIMRNLSDNLQDVIEIPSLNLDPALRLKNAVYC